MLINENPGGDQADRADAGQQIVDTVSGGGGMLVYAPPAPVGDLVFEVSWESAETVASFASTEGQLNLAARTVAGRVLDAAGFTFEVAFANVLDTSHATWLPVAIDPETGKGFVTISGLSADYYYRAWRVVNGDQTDGDWLPGFLLIR